jgi:CheY-like chemotaxis protein
MAETRGRQRLTRRGLRNRLVLIVEDDRDARELYSRYLVSRGFRVVTANDGLAALKIAQDQHPDLIVMDLGLPHLDGWETTRRMKSNPVTANIPVIACSGRLSPVSIERALDAGCAAFVPKPCSPPQLLEEIRPVLSGQRR